jgi:hypothetical protein
MTQSANVPIEDDFLQPEAVTKGVPQPDNLWIDEVDIAGESNIGPFTIKYTVYDTAVKVRVYLVGIQIASATLSAGSNQICASAKAGVVKGNICVVADFAAHELRVQGKHCYKKLDTSWQCKNFSKRIAGW